MADIRIIYTRPDGGIAIVAPGLNSKGDGETDAQWIDRVKAASVPADATNVHQCLASEITAHPRYRNAWVQGPDGLPTVDMIKARDVHRDHIRAAREKAWGQIDLAIRDASLAGDAAALSVAISRRDALRDATSDPAIEVAKNPAELELVAPAGLVL